ncbi:unnamed protein product [Adineta ricciae]|uniref:Uncharacterized protein n=1 Tax=Adineta ricciae TaxID=249248 RepID=A0A815BD42_ADIRI|nr:unnamed protein product [Adineta ricciae]
MFSQRVFLVTGGNRGIGFEIVKKLAVSHPNDLILLGSRDQTRGEDALVQLGSPSNVKVVQVDTSSTASIEQVRQEIENKYNGHLDVLINNAGIAPNGKSSRELKDIFNTNFYGVRHMNDTMASILRDNGRIVNVSSEAALLSITHCSSDLKARFLNPNLTETELVELFEPLFKAVEEGKDPDTVGFDPIEYPGLRDAYLVYYAASKLGVTVLSRLEARDWDKNYSTKNVIISSVCPGFCSTDLNNKAEGARPPELGADSILHCVYTENLENGQFWRDGKKLSLEMDEQRS